MTSVVRRGREALYGSTSTLHEFAEIHPNVAGLFHSKRSSSQLLFPIQLELFIKHLADVRMLTARRRIRALHIHFWRISCFTLIPAIPAS
jgi:hypothetical protein